MKAIILRRSFWLSLSASTIAALALGALILWYPFFGDQALFSVFARMIRGGSLLYSDIWDVKQPGIFWLFSGVGQLLGEGEAGIHLFEILYWVAAGVLVAVAVRPHLRRQWLAGLAPVLVPGLYFVAADVTDLSQVEGWVSPLIFFVVWLVLPRDGPSRARLVAAGALTGVIGLFKLLAMLVPGSVVMVALLTMQGRSPRRLGSSFGWFALGLAIPLGLLGWWVARNSLWEEVRFAWVDYPPQMLAVESRPPMRLVRSAGEFFLGFAVLIIPAVLRMARPSERGRRLTLLLIVACLATGLVILLQLWWAYLFYMFLVPVLVLGIQGLDDLRVRRPGAAWAVALLIVVALSPAVRDFAAKASRLAGLAGGEGLATYQSFDPGFLAATADVASSPVPHGSRVYVLGDPLIMELLESEQSIPINGWSPEFWTDELWRRVASDLRSGTTEALFISDPNREFALDRSAVFLTAVEEGFVETARTADGSWYVPRDQ